MAIGMISSGFLPCPLEAIERRQMTPQGERNVDRNHSTDYSCVNAGRRNSELAAQQIVGLWPERRDRAGLAYPDHSVADGKIVIVLLKHLYLASDVG